MRHIITAYHARDFAEIKRNRGEFRLRATGRLIESGLLFPTGMVVFCTT